jgi:hypothetical protein
VTDACFLYGFAALSGHGPVEIRSLSVLLLCRQTDGYCTLPVKLKNLDCGAHPASQLIKIS